MKKNLEENKYNKLEESMKAMASTKVLIAVIGQSGVGKSYFINNMLGLNEGDEGAAEVGDGDTTTKRTVYSHPQNRNLEFADLPGVGTPDFEMSDKYLEKMKAEIHDFFLIFYPATIGDPEKKVIEKLLALKKKFALVRTKADEMTRRREKPLHQSIATSKDKSRTNLEKFGIAAEVEIFVISNINLEIGEFNQLFAFMETNLSRIKREALIVHIHAQTEEIIGKKEKYLTRRAWKAAAFMGIATSVPIPGFDIPINVAALAGEVIFALYTFGLNFEMLVKFPVETFKQLKTAFDIHQKGLNSFIIANIAKAPVVISGILVQQAIEMLLPVTGSLITGSVAYKFYINFLRDVIKRLAGDARTLRKLHVESVV
ncbi:hypothetical protein FSP39_014048 [Pinctada imbricata]|uniref:IRG-type G domain-containing protein n=1 Tax=Pinctada imbricata TaxID=66713 RepID=A0AA89C6U0_PINIB|nr:hypothetical protein FSP39_014048 [Pinctada imbricata]